ncbi:hypothetical protein HDU97_000111 [Phlyctochytrium planicorne]|nr:hypothetical protein HDU97_000111 [Phlyctochytrium planicorne]
MSPLGRHGSLHPAIRRAWICQACSGRGHEGVDLKPAWRSRPFSSSTLTTQNSLSSGNDVSENNKTRSPLFSKEEPASAEDELSKALEVLDSLKLERQADSVIGTTPMQGNKIQGSQFTGHSKPHQKPIPRESTARSRETRPNRNFRQTELRKPPPAMLADLNNLWFEAGQETNGWELEWWKAQPKDFQLEEHQLRFSPRFQSETEQAELPWLFVGGYRRAVSKGDWEEVNRYLNEDALTLSVEEILRALSLLRNTPLERNDSHSDLPMVKRQVLLQSYLTWALFSTLIKIPGGPSGLTRPDWHYVIKSTIFDVADLGEHEDKLLQEIVVRGIPSLAVRPLIVMKEMKGSGTSPDDVMYAALIRSSCKDMRKVMAIHDHVKQEAASSDPVPTVPASLISDFYARQLLFAFTHFKPVVPISKPVYEFNQDDVTRNWTSKETLIERLWDETKEAKSKPSRWTCIGFLQAFRESANKTMVENVHRALVLDRKAAGGEGSWDQSIFWALMKAHAACGNHLAVERLFLEMVEGEMSPNQPFLIELIRSLFNRELYDEVRKAFLAMVTNYDKINEEILIITIKSLAVLKDKATLRLIHKRLNSLIPVSASTTPSISARPYIDLITAFSSFEDVRGCMIAFQDFKVRREMALRQGQKNVETAKDIQLYLVPRKTLADVVYLLALKGLREDILSFFELEAFSSERIEHHWRRIIDGHQSKRNEALENIKLRMEDVKEMSEAPRNLRFAERKKIANLSGKAAVLEKELNEGPPLRVGAGGPFRIVYEALDGGWRNGAERLENGERFAEGGNGSAGNGDAELGERLMVLEEVTVTLKDMERRAVKAMVERTGLKIKMSRKGSKEEQGSDEEVDDESGGADERADERGHE